MNLNKKVCKIRSSLYLHKFSHNIIMLKDKKPTQPEVMINVWKPRKGYIIQEECVLKNNNNKKTLLFGILMLCLFLIVYFQFRKFTENESHNL